jgi:hypothetical protein
MPLYTPYLYQERLLSLFVLGSDVELTQLPQALLLFLF